MKEVTLKIPDKRFGFFMELIKQLGFEVAGETDQIDIPEEHKAIVRERIKKSCQNPDRLMEWDKVKDNFRLE
ncbi:MAG: hypothetical protein KDD36_14540 [Flavobacteriales bacterium]|nr:hypothetical protein [Flavobacteriales bacterium]